MRGDKCDWICYAIRSSDLVNIRLDPSNLVESSSLRHFCTANTNLCFQSEVLCVMWFLLRKLHLLMVVLSYFSFLLTSWAGAWDKFSLQQLPITPLTPCRSLLARIYGHSRRCVSGSPKRGSGALDSGWSWYHSSHTECVNRDATCLQRLPTARSRPRSLCLALSQ